MRVSGQAVLLGGASEIADAGLDRGRPVADLVPGGAVASTVVALDGDDLVLAAGAPGVAAGTGPSS